jgi:uncharacterized protein YeaO (DUF488 family)
MSLEEFLFYIMIGVMLLCFVSTILVRLLCKKDKIKSQNWPGKTGHSEHYRDKFDQHGRKFCKFCKAYHNGYCAQKQ